MGTGRTDEFRKDAVQLAPDGADNISATMVDIA